MHLMEKMVDFTKLSTEKQQALFKKLESFDRKIFPNAVQNELYQLLYNHDVVALPIIRFYHRGKIVGQNIIAILKLNREQQTLYIVNSRAAFLPDYRNQNRSLMSAIRVALGYRLKYPTRQLWFVSSLMQPNVYRLFASRSKRFYPRVGAKMPEEYLQVLELMQNRHENVQQRSEDVFVHPCVLPQTTPEQLIRLRNRASPHINFYMQHAPDYFIGMGLICICKLDLFTLVDAALNLLLGREVA